MPKSCFNFEGGEYLTKIGASWFVSYSYYFYIDKQHKNWDKITTSQFRINVFNRTKEFHKIWLEQITVMNDKKLNVNTIGLEATEIKQMAAKLLKL